MNKQDILDCIHKTQPIDMDNVLIKKIAEAIQMNIAKYKERNCIYVINYYNSLDAEGEIYVTSDWKRLYVNVPDPDVFFERIVPIVTCEFPSCVINLVKRASCYKATYKLLIFYLENLEE